MNNAALIVKILSRRAKLTTPLLSQVRNDKTELIRFLPKKKEQKFVSTFTRGLMSKDLQRYLALWRGIGTLDEIDRLSMQRIVGTEIDLQNILWVFRLKKFYEIYGDNAYSYLIPIRYRISKDSFTKMVECKDILSFKSEVSTTIYNSIFTDFKTPEQHMASTIKMRYRAEGRHSHIALLCGYLYEMGINSNDNQNEIHKHIRAYGQYGPCDKQLFYTL